MGSYLSRPTTAAPPRLPWLSSLLVEVGFASRACCADPGAKSVFLDCHRDELNDAVAHGREEAALAHAANFRQQLAVVEENVVRLGPRHGLFCFDEQDGILEAALRGNTIRRHSRAIGWPA